MEHATLPGSAARGAFAFLKHLAHGGLLTAGLTAVAWQGSAFLEHGSVHFADTGVVEARAAVRETPAIEEAAPEISGVAALSAEMQRVSDYVAQRYKVSTVALEPVLAAAEASGKKLGVDPLLIVAVMAIESRFNPFAESPFGAQGLMQVIPRFHMDKIGTARGADALFDPDLNIQVGTQVLVEGMRRFGSLQGALQYYAGASDDPDASYATKVLALKKRLMSAAGRRTGSDA